MRADEFNLNTSLLGQLFGMCVQLITYLVRLLRVVEDTDVMMLK